MSHALAYWEGRQRRAWGTLVLVVSLLFASAGWIRAEIEVGHHRDTILSVNELATGIKALAVTCFAEYIPEAEAAVAELYKYLLPPEVKVDR